MRVTPFGHCVQITFYPTVFPVNCYLVKEDDGLTLVDAAMAKCAPHILAVAESLGMPIVRIALTHAHSDHVGSLDALYDALRVGRPGTLQDAQAGVEVMISSRDARLLGGDRSVDANEPQGKIKGAFQPLKTQPTRLVEEGDRIGSLEVVSCAGHTPGHVAFLDRRDGALLAGDALQTRAGMAVAGMVRPLFPFPAMATWDRGTALQSAKKLVSMRPSFLGVGHGDVVQDPVEQMTVAINKAERTWKGMR